MDLVTFLNARLNEDEAAAKLAQTVPAEGWYEVAQQAVACTDTIELSPAYEHIARHDPARVLREVEAKRRILDDHSRVMQDMPWNPSWNCARCSPQPWPCPTVLALAAVRSDHPDYDPAWA